jgi:hypothetical protein
MKRILLTILTLAVAGTSLHCGDASPGLTIEDAREFMASYLEALSSGGLDEIRGFWSQESLSRDGFETMHLWVGATIHISGWAGFFEDSGLTYTIKGVRREDGYHVIDGLWVAQDEAPEAPDAAGHETHHYIVREGRRWVLGNPIDVLTRHWDSREADHLIFYYAPGVDIEDYLDILDLVDRRCGDMLNALELKLETKIEFYKVDTPRECGRLMSFPPANGYAAIQMTNDPEVPAWFDVVVSTSFNNPHEVMHVLAAKAGIPYVSAAFCEGFAVAFGGTTFQDPELAPIKTRSLIDTPAYVDLVSLLTMPDSDFLRASHITYQEAGAFFRFLIDRFGMAKARQFCNEMVMIDDVNGAAQAVYGCTIDEIEAIWHADLFDLDIPDIGSAIPADAEIVFAMTDPAGDDLGDGDYAYPADEAFVAGCFDLREFVVLSDLAHVYFRIKLENVIMPVTNAHRGERFAPGVLIAVMRDDLAVPHREHTCHGIQFEEDQGFDLKIAAGFGVCTADHFGKVGFTTGDLSDMILKAGYNTIEFSLPIEMIGKPDASWSYFVGMGLMSDRAMDFFGGPVPVLKSSRMLISGGNFDHGNPAFIDILLPGNLSQQSLLGDYDPDSRRLATIPMIASGAKMPG